MVVTMNVRVAACAPTTPPETGASSNVGICSGPMLSESPTNYKRATMSNQLLNQMATTDVSIKIQIRFHEHYMLDMLNTFYDGY